MLPTLGPWESTGGASAVAVVGVDGRVVATVGKPADARLIAQAPEMLRLLKEWRERHDGSSYANRNEIDLVIGRAEGHLG